MLALLHRALKWTAVAAVAIVAAGLVAPYIRADYFRNRIQRSLEQSLGRKVELGRVRYNVFTGPGFTVDDVLIGEDERVGVEPFAHVPEMSVTVSPWNLFTGTLRFSSLRLVEPSMNLARSTGGLWNVQLFLDRPPQIELPEIQIREGRVNFKSGDRKNVIFFGNVDADVRAGPGLVRFNVSGEPFRTDRAALHVGVWGARGTWDGRVSPSSFDGEVEIERTGITELIHLFEGRDPGLRGFVASGARVSGPVNALKIQGKVRLDDLSERLFRPALPPSALSYSGTLDLPGQKIALTTGDSGSLPVSVQLDASRLLSDPDWHSLLSFRDFEAPALADGARQLGVELPAGFAVNGKLRGEVELSRAKGVAGAITVSQAEVRVGEGVAFAGRAMSFQLTGPQVDLQVKTEEPKPVDGSAAQQPGQVDARFDLSSRDMEIQISERNGSVAEWRKLAPDVPLLSQFDQGTWRGSLRWRRPGAALIAAGWQGQIDVAEATAKFTGLADPVTLSFSAAIDGPKAAVRGLRGKAGKLVFAGDYRYEPGAARPHRLNLAIERASIEELERLLLPSLARGRGLLGRLPFAKSAEPEWLADRRVEGAIRIAKLTAADATWTAVAAKLQWNGATAKLTDVTALWGDAKVRGEIQADLSGAKPRYAAEGDVGPLPCRGGVISVDGKIKSEGLGAQVVANATGSGSFDARAVQFSGDAPFDTAEGDFELAFVGAKPMLKLSNVKVQQGIELLSGQGGTQADGKLALELAGSGRKPLRLLGSLSPAPGVAVEPVK